MSDAAQPTVAEVRAAAEAVKAALDRHLAAVERRSGEDDPAVYEAFNELAVAAEEYDELLYDRYDEVTPFEIPGSEDALPPYTGPEEPNAVSVLIRRDYSVVEPQRLMAQAQRVEAAEADGAPLVDTAGTTVHGALGVLFGEFEPDEIASRHKEFGLEEGDSTLWVTATDDPEDPGVWLESPFEHADPQRVVCRFDVSAVFDDEDIVDIDDLDDDIEDTVRTGAVEPRTDTADALTDLVGAAVDDDRPGLEDDLDIEPTSGRDDDPDGAPDPDGGDPGGEGPQRRDGGR
ncbi:hypothetical protein GT204_21745 [Streptomyces sp. SID4919]|uniref:hypothetical protein n=1 Tax=unclassified Streptomyces TaxID=2593676 RepID=UPI000823F01D|nr:MULTISPECIES: hypothetical protein [unclassified Streptomyces]MYY11456.1 hypothetical protein [Streptomyces sp. SID4919]SCK57987.1 hypothetical protein YW7DRAFT_05496 [Streptomyces sp. AmelKG-E11A]